MAAQSGVINTLSLNGAPDGAIAGLYQARYGRLAAGAGAVGAGLAMAMLATLRVLGGTEGVTPALPLAWADLLILSPCPLLAGTVALVAARFTALARLKRGH
jgi:cell division transport system permease protein